MFRNTDVGVFTQSLQGSEQKFVVRGRSDAAINPHSYPYVKDNCLFGSGFKHLPSAPRSSWPAQKPDPALANWDGQRQHRQEHWRGCGNGFECPDVGHDVRSDMVHRRGKESWRRRRLLNADVEICRPMQSHGASLIVSTESLYSPDL